MEELRDRNADIVESFSKVRKQMEVETAVMLGTADGEVHGGAGHPSDGEFFCHL